MIDQRYILGILSILFVLLMMFTYFGHRNLKSIGLKQLTTDTTLKRLADTVLELRAGLQPQEIIVLDNNPLSQEQPVILEPEYQSSDEEDLPSTVLPKISVKMKTPVVQKKCSNVVNGKKCMRKARELYCKTCEDILKEPTFQNVESSSSDSDSD